MHTPFPRLFAFGLGRIVPPFAHSSTSPASTPLTSSALQLLNKYLCQANRYTGMLIVPQYDNAKKLAVIPAGTYRRERTRALTDFVRALVQISELIEAGAQTPNCGTHCWRLRPCDAAVRVGLKAE